jgi:hypothetical protein
MGCQMHKVNRNIKYKGTKNRPSKPLGSITKNLKWCLQRYGILGYEKIETIDF